MLPEKVVACRATLYRGRFSSMSRFGQKSRICLSAGSRMSYAARTANGGLAATIRAAPWVRQAGGRAARRGGGRHREHRPPHPTKHRSRAGSWGQRQHASNPMTTAAAIECPYDIRSLNGDPEGLPLVIQARQDRDPHGLCVWIGAHHDWIAERLRARGALLFRGFDVSTAPAVDRFRNSPFTCPGVVTTG